MPCEAQLQVPAHIRPLARKDAVHHRIAGSAILACRMVTKNPVFLGAERFDRPLRPEIEVVRAQSDDLAAERVERVTEQDQLARRVEARTLPAARVPGVT